MAKKTVRSLHRELTEDTGVKTTPEHTAFMHLFPWRGCMLPKRALWNPVVFVFESEVEL